MTTQEIERARVAWEKVATGFDKFVTPMTMSLAEDALGRVNLRPGMRFLDVAAGCGALSIPAARLGAEVLATDISPTMIERLVARAQAEELTSLEGRVMDGLNLELEDDSFDIAGSQNGVSVFPDLKRGLSEMVRVTKPGGQTLIVAFGPLPKTEFVAFFLGAVQTAVPGFAGPGPDRPPLPFQVADPDKLRQELAGASLHDVRVETTTWRMAFRSARHYWDAVLNSNPIAKTLVANLTEEQRFAVRQVLDSKLRERSAGDGSAVLTNSVNIGIGTK